MNIEEPLRHLGPVNMDALRDAVLAQTQQAWLENPYRQESYDVHRQTESIVLTFCDNGWPELKVTMEPGWDRLADVAVPLMRDIVGRCYPTGGTIIRAMAAKLVAGGRIRPHFDANKTFSSSHRIHVPLTTNPRVRFIIDGRAHQMEVGQAYEINNQLTHSVMNSGKEDRITFIFDYMPPEAIIREPADARPAERPGQA
jgi:hypothetical protein